MKVQQLFKEILDTNKNKEEFVKYYLRYIDTNVKGRNKKQKLLKLINDICNCPDVKEDENLILFFIPDYPKQDKEDCINTFLVHKDQLIEHTGNSQCDKITTYAYEFQPMRDILGYRVSDACLYAFKGKFRALGAILYEMTFFGYTIEAQEQSALDEMENIENSVKEIEEHPEQLIKWDDIKVEFEEKYKIKPQVKSTRDRVFDDCYNQIECDFFTKLKYALFRYEVTVLKDKT